MNVLGSLPAAQALRALDRSPIQDGAAGASAVLYVQFGADPKRAELAAAKEEARLAFNAARESLRLNPNPDYDAFTDEQDAHAVSYNVAERAYLAASKALSEYDAEQADTTVEGEGL